MLQRAYSVLEVKSVDDELRELHGIATSIEPDRVGDVVVPRGAKFSLPLPLLWQHQADHPIGHVIAAHVDDNGIRIHARIAKGVTARIDEAWSLIRAGLVRGLSIGFRPLRDPELIKGTLGLKFSEWEWMELSAVTIPANSEASIAVIKTADTTYLNKPYDSAQSVPGRSAVASAAMPGVTGSRSGHSMTYQEQIEAYTATRQSKAARMDELMKKSGEANATLDEAGEQEFELLERDVEGIDKHLARLAKMETVNKAAAKPAAGHSADAAAQSRGGHTVTVVQPKLPPGIGFARAVKAITVAKLDGRNMVDVAKEMYPSDERLMAHLTHRQQLAGMLSHIKAAVPAGTTVQADWAADLVDPTNLPGEFIEYLRPATIIGKFGTNGIPDLRRVPFNTRMIEQTQGGTGYWVGQGAPKPLTAFGFNAVTLAFTKVAAISVITEELARFSSPSAETLVRDGLRDALVERIDRDFIDPAEAGTANVQPASITNGLTALTSAGTSADNARTDLANIMADFVSANLDPQGVVIIMPTTLALALSFQVNSLGQPEFPGLNMEGGRINGIPVITSQYAANASGGGNLVIAVNAREVFLADDGQVSVDASREASLQMLDNPTNNSATATATQMVSMWQTNSIALRAERFINWSKRRTDAVVYMDDVNWGAIGSPA